jgi:hypothetical protein
MSDLQANPVGPVAPVSSAPPVRPVERETPSSGAPGQHDVAAVTGGSLKGAYAQLVINPDTHDVVIRVRDSATDEILSEYPSSAVEHMATDLMHYLETLERRRAAKRSAKS